MKFGTMECDSGRSSVVKLRYRIETVGDNEIEVVDRDSVGGWCLLQSSKVTVRDLVVSWYFTQVSEENVHVETEVNAYRECCTIRSA